MPKFKSSNRNLCISVIIPLYNEEKRLKNLFRIYNYFNSRGLQYEVILINDGSTDGTFQEINRLSKKYKLNCISYQKNMGKGFAIKRGMLEASGDFLLFSDIDLSTPVQELDKFLPFLKEYDILIGSRKTRNAVIKKHQPFIREHLGKGFTLISQVILKLTISDFTCGFKCFSKQAAKDIFSKQTIKGWGFDPETLFIANKLGYGIKEIPVEWSDDPNSKVSFPRDIVNSLLDLYLIRLNEINNIY